MQHHHLLTPLVTPPEEGDATEPRNATRKLCLTSVALLCSARILSFKLSEKCFVRWLM